MTDVDSKNVVKNIFSVIEQDMLAVDEMIYRQLHANTRLIDEVGQYIIGSGGKRIRPALVVLLAKALGYTGNHHITLAATIEFIHTATLLHDDVVDQGEKRRGKVSANRVYGNAASVLVGDFLHTRAFQMMVSVSQMAILQVLSDATNKIAQGEVMQLVNTHNTDTTKEAYFDVIDAKTAQLFEASAQIGALVAKAPVDDVIRAKQIGHNLGMAFQIVDDCLDYVGEIEQIGKTIGNDLKEGKMTLPLIYLMQQSEQELKDKIIRVLKNHDEALMKSIVEAVKQSGALDYCQKHINRYTQLAIEAINGLPDSVYKQALMDLARFSGTRAF